MSPTIEDNDKGQPHERRRLLRLNDTITVRHRHIAASDASRDPYSAEFDLPAHFELQSELARIETSNRHLLRVINGESRETGLYLAALSRKLDLLAAAIVAAPADAQLTSTATTLSEGGISLPVDTGLAEGSFLHLLIHNREAHYNIAVIGRIVNCRHGATGPVTGIEFTTLRDSDRQLIFRYLMRKQREERQDDMAQWAQDEDFTPG